MAGLITLVANNISKLIVLPILALVIIGLTYFISKNNDDKIVKFYPSFIIGIVGLAIGIIAFVNLTTAIGLNLAWSDFTIKCLYRNFCCNYNRFG